MANLTAAKLRRRAKRSPQTSDAPSGTEDEDDSLKSSYQHASIRDRPKPPSVLALTMSSATPSCSSARLLIASLGNPPPLHTTRHSAGHIILRSLISHLRFPTPRRDSSFAGATVTTSPDIPAYTFYQSPTFMNVSGPTLLKAWKHFTSTHGSDHAGLIILHDELELSLGQVKVKRGNGSAKGHNGIKSIQSSFQGGGLLEKLGQNFIRIGVGIGRPVSRERDDVSQFVLGQMNATEKAKIEGAASSLELMLMKEAERIERG